MALRLATCGANLALAVRRRRSSLLVFAALVGCAGSAPSPDAGPDAGADAGADVDAGLDAGAVSCTGWSGAVSLADGGELLLGEDVEAFTAARGLVFFRKTDGELIA